jgi:ComF family protein
LFQEILDIIYPVRCPLCGDIVVPKGNQICPACREKLPYINEPRCMKCSKPLEQEEKEYCNDCERKSYHFNKGYAVWTYNDRMKQSVANFKYHNKKEYAEFYIDEVIRNYAIKINRMNVDVIVPIPIHRSKYLERGYNQADILAKGIGKRTGITVISDLLLRNRKTMPQKELSDVERLKNLTGAFGWNEAAAKKYNRVVERVLLIDDIYTTGSTIEACSSILKAHGVLEIYFIVLCIGKGF